MKTLSFILLFATASFYSFCQSSDFFKYQAVIRNNGGHPVKNQTVSIRIGILEGSVDGNTIYSEQHQATTSDFGTVSLNVGGGDVLSGGFSSIDWGANSHYLKIEVDYDNTNNFVDAGTSQLLSVPYALYSKTSGDQKWLSSGDDIHYNIGNVGIGTTNPEYQLDVNGAINASSLFVNGSPLSSPWTVNESDVYYENGNVGIGTSAPLESLHVNGNIRGGQQGGAIRVQTDFGYMDIGAKNADYAHFYTAMPYGFYFGGSVTVRDHLIGYKESDLHISTQSPFTYQPVERISILNSNGYVGIGKTNPEYQLDVNGTINASSILVNGSPLSQGSSPWIANDTDIYFEDGKVGIGTDTPLESLHVNGNIRGGQQGGAIRVQSDFGYLDIGAKNADYAHFYTDMPYGFAFGGSVTVKQHLIGYKDSDLHISTQSPTTYQPVKRISILNSNGNVGIGKTNPGYALDVNGTINASAILVNGNPIGSGETSSLWSLNGTDAYYNDGKVGIGTVDPQETLHINGNIRGAQQGGAVRVQTEHGYLDIGAKNPDYAHFYTDMPYGFAFGGSVTVKEHLIGYRTSDLNLSTQSPDTYQPVKRITILNSNGNVGIGTENPQAKLQVESGDIYLKDSAKGVIMKSPNGQCWRMTVSDAGAPVFTSITCPD